MARLRPSPRRPAPPPLQTNDVAVALAGTVGWVVALVVLLVVGLPADTRWWLWVCVAGIVIGLFAIWYVPRLHRGHAAAERRTAAHPPAEASPRTTESQSPGPPMS